MQLALVAPAWDLRSFPARSRSAARRGGLRPLAGGPKWEPRAARSEDEVLSVGTLAVCNPLRSGVVLREASDTAARAHYAA
jgi:hypothetical protein